MSHFNCQIDDKSEVISQGSFNGLGNEPFHINNPALPASESP